MLNSITAIRFDGRVLSGRTAPCRLTCEAADGAEVEVVAKLSDGCDRKITAPAMEAITALLHIAQVRDNIEAALQEVTRALS